MLDKGMTKYVQKRYVQKLANCGYEKETQRVYDGRLRVRVKKALKDLTLLADNLPEEQLTQLFNSETLTPFFQALFKLEIGARGKDHNDWLQKKKELKPKRDRLLKLSGAVLRKIGDGKFAVTLLPESLRFELDQMKSSIENLRVVFHTSMQEQEREDDHSTKS